MSDIPPDRPEEDGPEAIAGEYVLGVLGPAEHAAASGRMAQDPGFAAEVEAWERRLTPLVDRIDPVEPPARVWPAIAARLTGTVTPMRPRATHWNGVGLWRGVAAGASALAAACLVLVLLPKTQSVPAVPPASAAIVSVARLEAPNGGGTAFIATLDETGRRMVIVPTGAPGPAGKSPELWLMPPKATPVSLGVFMGGQALVVPVPAGVAPGAELGVSLEPLGGSPSGAPTGPVIAVGNLMRL